MTYELQVPRKADLVIDATNGKATLYMDDLWLRFRAVVTKLPPGTPAIEGIPPAKNK